MAKVIVIEDEPVLRELLVDELEDAGHRVFEACDGAEGIAKIEEENPDVIVSDIGMPRMDGLELRRHLQDCPRFINTPFFFVTALPYEAAIDEGIDIKTDAYLNKPVDLDVLLERISASAN